MSGIRLHPGETIEHALALRILERVEEMESDIQRLRDIVHDDNMAIQSCPLREVDIFCAHAGRTQEQAEDLERRRDALLASPRLAKEGHNGGS